MSKKVVSAASASVFCHVLFLSMKEKHNNTLFLKIDFFFLISIFFSLLQKSNGNKLWIYQNRYVI